MSAWHGFCQRCRKIWLTCDNISQGKYLNRKEKYCQFRFYILSNLWQIAEYITFWVAFCKYEDFCQRNTVYAKKYYKNRALSNCSNSIIDNFLTFFLLTKLDFPISKTSLKNWKLNVKNLKLNVENLKRCTLWVAEWRNEQWAKRS